LIDKNILPFYLILVAGEVEMKLLVVGSVCFLMIGAASASHSINSTSKSGQRVLITDMFWPGTACAGVEISSFSVVNNAQNGIVTQVYSKGKFSSSKYKINPPHSCEGKNIPVSEVYYQSKKDFKGRDFFSVRWVNANGQTRDQNYSISVE
jgi:hypothetical protein